MTSLCVVVRGLPPAGRAGSQIVVPLRCDEYDYRHLRLMGDLGQIAPMVSSGPQWSSIALIGHGYWYRHNRTPLVSPLTPPPPPQEFHLKDEESVRKAVQHSNVVINLIGRDYETWCVCVCVLLCLCEQWKWSMSISSVCSCVHRNFKYSEVHVDGARVIAEACRQTGVQRLIHFSALSAHSSSPSRFLQSKARHNVY